MYKTLKEKLKIIYFPSLLALLLSIIGYTFLHWLLLIKLEIFQINETYVNFGVPFFIVGLLAWVFVRKRLKILTLGDRTLDIYCILLMIIFFIPFYIAQLYIVTTTGQITALESINDIHKTKYTKYYSLEHCVIDKEHIEMHTEFSTNGKRNKRFNMQIYIVMPILDNQEELFNADFKGPSAWLGVVYATSISNRLDNKEKEHEYENFVIKTKREFAEKDMASFQYLNKIGHSDDRNGYLRAIKDSPYTASSIILEPINEPFAQKDGKKAKWIFITIFIASIVLLIMTLVHKVGRKRLKHYRSGRQNSKHKKGNLTTLLLILQNVFFVTPTLICINVIIFLVMFISGMGFLSFRGEDLIIWGANYGPLVRSGEWWRLITNIFLHGGALHILLNMYGLLFIGIFLEPLLGRLRYLTVYLLSGIVASIASIMWYDETISIGASGAIFGLFGASISLALMKCFPHALSRFILINISIFIGISLLGGLTGGIDNAAHIGGLTSGLIIGFFFSKKLPRCKQTG